MAKITRELITDIITLIGGAGNVTQCGNCMTRLRLTLGHPSPLMEQIGLLFCHKHHRNIAPHSDPGLHNVTIPLFMTSAEIRCDISELKLKPRM